MNLKTTLALLVLVLCGAGLFWSGGRLPWPLDFVTAPVEVADEGSREVLAHITPASLREIKIVKGDQTTVLTRKGERWTLEGGWEARAGVVKQLVELLGNLRSRYEPEAVEKEKEWQKRGLGKPAIVVEVKTTSGKHQLRFGQPPAGKGGFDQPTWLRVDDRDEALRLAPGIVARLDRPADYYTQRRVFPARRVARKQPALPPLPGMPPPEAGVTRVDRLDAARLEVEGSGHRFVLERRGEGWELAAPMRDRLDPSDRDNVLEAAADLWAERFVAPDKGKTLDDYGLDRTARRIVVTRADGTKTVLLIGRDVDSLDLKGGNRAYARLDGSTRVFEVRAARLDALFVEPDKLRDPRALRFDSKDARKVEVRKGGEVLVLERDDRPSSDGERPNWKVVKPYEAEADRNAVSDLLSRLGDLTAQDRDVGARATVAGLGLMAADGLAKVLGVAVLDPHRGPALFGLQQPEATVTVTVEDAPEEGGTPRRRTLTLEIGRRDKGAKKLFVRQEDWPRIDAVDDALGEQVLDRTPLDYRDRTLVDAGTDDVSRITVVRTDLTPLGLSAASLGVLPNVGAAVTGLAGLAADRTGTLVLERVDKKGDWRLTAPVSGPADTGRADELAGKLAKLDAQKAVARNVSADELQAKYGLGVPSARITVALTGKSQGTKTLLLGRLADGGGVYARLEGAGEVYLLPADLVPVLDRSALAYRPLELWKLKGPDDVVRMTITPRGQAPFTLERKDGDWQVSGAFTTRVPANEIEGTLKALVGPKAESWRAHQAKELSPYGLEKPAVEVVLTDREKKTHTIAVGDHASGSVGRYARFDKGAGVVVVGDAFVQAVDRSALEFLDRNVLSFDAEAVVGLKRKMGKEELELVKKDDWRVARPDEPADQKEVTDLLARLSKLQATKIAAYGEKDLTKYGLDAPEAEVTVDLGDKKTKTIQVGKVVSEPAGDRYVRIDGGPIVAVVPGTVAKPLLAGALRFRDRGLARFTDAEVAKLDAGRRKATFTKEDGTWKLTAPVKAEADDSALEGLLNDLSRLRADELVVEKPSPADLRKYGLEKPFLRWRFEAGPKTVLDLSVGDLDRDGKRRYARVAGKGYVVLLEPEVSKKVTAEYRPRNVWKEPIDVTKVEALRFGFPGAKAFTLKKAEDGWQVDGKADTKVTEAAVNETLAALRNLQLVRYVADKDDLTLYGLEPPDLALEITLPMGKKLALHVGGQEEGRKRRYAHVPGAKRSDVFLLEENDARRIFRELAAFTRVEEKSKD